jgi:hypothetical protein
MQWFQGLFSSSFSSKTMSFWAKSWLSSIYVLDNEFSKEKLDVFKISRSDSSSFSKMGDNSLLFGDKSSIFSKSGCSDLNY